MKIKIQKLKDFTSPITEIILVIAQFNRQLLSKHINNKLTIEYSKVLFELFKRELP